MYFHVLRISNPGRLRFAAVAADRVDVLNNRRLTAVLPCALAALLVVAAACSTSVSGPGGAASNGTSSGSTATGTGAPAKAWVADDLHVVSQVAATDQEALVTAQDKDGTLEGTALDTATGKVLWQHANTPADGIQGVGILAPAPVKRSGGWLAVEIEDAGGKVALGDPYAYVARDSRTGKQVWRHPVSDTSTFIPCGNLFCFDTLDDQYAGTLVAVDPETGKTRWTYAASTQFTFVGADAKTIDIETLGTGTTVIGLDASTGKVLWTSSGAAALGTGATTDAGWNSAAWQDVVLADLDADSAHGPAGTFAIDRRTGKRLWTAKGAHLPIVFLVGLYRMNDFGTIQGDGPVVLEQSTFTSSTYEVRALEGVDLHTGKVQWTIPVNFSVKYADFAGTVPIGVVGADRTRAWVVDPTGSKPFGFDPATGRSVPVAGSGWSVTFGDSKEVKVPALDESFTGPVGTRHLSVPGPKAVAGGVPPAEYCAMAGKVCAWLAGDLKLHGAPGS